MSIFLKDPDASLTYTVDWAGRGYLDGDAIAASAWSVEPAGLAITGETLAGALASATVSGGVAGHDYLLTNRVTLASGQIDERSITIRVGSR